MNLPQSNPEIPAPSSEFTLPQIQEDKNDDKRDSLETMADITNDILNKIAEINETPTSISKPPTQNLLLFFAISGINSFLLFLELPEIVSFLFLRILTFASIFLGFSFFGNLVKVQKIQFFVNIVAISTNFLTSTIVIQATGALWGKFSFWSVEDHAICFVKDAQSTILFLALFLMRNNAKNELVNLAICFLGIMLGVHVIFARICLNEYFPLVSYLEIVAWYVLSLVGIKILNNQNKAISVEKQKKINTVETETKKVLNILNQVQNSLQENYDQMAPTTITKADDLLRKLKFLKFQALLNLKNQPTKGLTPKSISPKSMTPKANFQNSKFGIDCQTDFMSPSNKKKKTFNSTNRTGQLLSPTYRKFSKTYVKKNTTVMDTQKAILIQKIDAYDFAPGADKIQKDKRWSLTPEDLDDIMQGMLNKPNMFWLPTFLNQYKNNHDNGSKDWFPKETKDFLLSHFTEEQNPKNFADDLSIIKQNTFELDLKLIDLNPLNDYLINVCENWNYDVFLLHTLTNGNVVIEFGYCIFRKFKIRESLKIEDNSLVSNFLYNVQILYKNNPYHNSMHAADVTNSIGFFLTKGMNQVFDRFESACLVISALAHDVGHPGLNNAFLVASKSRYAIIYNDSSVLENYHSSALFQILVNPKSDVTANLTEKEFRLFRKLCIGMILDTDLQKHFVIMNKFKNLLALGEFDMKDESNRHLALSAALKCADIGHGAKGLELHKKWSRRIIEEFFNQGDLEMKHGMPVSPLCDRKSDVAKSQEGFLKCIVLPLFEAFEQFAAIEIITQHCSEQIKKNLVYWDNQKSFSEQQMEGAFMEETKEVYNEISKFTSKTSDDSASCISCN